MPTLAVVEFTHKSGFAEDSVNNTFVFGGDATDPAVVGRIVTDIADFYNGGATAADRICTYMHRSLKRGAADSWVRTFDLAGHLDGSPHGSPTFETAFTLGADDGTAGLAPEVCAVLSYRAPVAGLLEEGPGETRPRSRRRGRLYIGPLNLTARSEDAPAYIPRPSSGLMAAMAGAAERLLVDTPGALRGDWSVWSRAGAQIASVVGGHVDQEFDTQRRRGIKTATRDEWGASA